MENTCRERRVGLNRCASQSQRLWHSMETTTNRGNREGLHTFFARLHQACMRAPLQTLHFFFLSWSAMLILPHYLKYIPINIDVSMLFAKPGVAPGEEEKMTRVQWGTQASVMQPCEEGSPRDCPDLLWFACCAREVQTETHAHSDLSRRVSVFCLADLTHLCACSVLFTSTSVHMAQSRSAIAKCRNRPETSPIAPFPGMASLAAQHTHAKYNKSGRLRRLTHRVRKDALRLHPCAIAHASFFLPLLERNAHSTSLFEMYFDKYRCQHVSCKKHADINIYRNIFQIMR